MSARGRPRRRLRRRCSSPARSSWSGCRRTPTGARCATAPPGFTYDDDARPLGVPGGRAPVAARVRPRAPPRALPRQGARLQRAARARTPAPTPTAAARSSGPLDPWPHSEAGRFHRAISLLMVALGAARPRRRGRPPPRGRRRLALLARRCWWPARSRPAGWRATSAPTRPTSRRPSPVARPADGRHGRRRAPDARSRRLAGELSPGRAGPRSRQRPSAGAPSPRLADAPARVVGVRAQFAERVRRRPRRAVRPRADRHPQKLRNSSAPPVGAACASSAAQRRSLRRLAHPCGSQPELDVPARARQTGMLEQRGSGSSSPSSARA